MLAGDPASPEKLRDYSEHQAATYHFPGAPWSLEPAALAARLLNSLLPSRRRLLRPEYVSDALNASRPYVVQASPLLTARLAPQTTESATRSTT